MGFLHEHKAISRLYFPLNGILAGVYTNVTEFCFYICTRKLKKIICHFNYSQKSLHDLIHYFFSPQNRVLSCALQTYSGRYPFCSIIFLMESWNSPAVSWLAEAASPVMLTFSKASLFSKIIKPFFAGTQFSSFIPFTFLML